jgi:Tol biopolymer transport system component
MLGTFQYMAPEQLEGKEADARTDLFAFGALVHEMLTGKRAFEGASRANLIAAILTSDPPPASTLTPSVPPGLDHVISRCLTKNPDDRWQTARDLMLELRAIERRTSGTPSSADSGTERTTEGIRQDDDARRVGTGSRLAWKLGIAAALTTAVAVWLWWRAVRESDSAPSVALAQYQSEIPPPQDTSVGTIALSPDGQRLAFVGRTGAQTQLWVRALNAVAAQPLAGTDGAAYPFWSADGRNLGFFAEGKLKRIDASGGPPVTLSDAPSGRGGTWSEHDVIVFAPNILSLHRVAASGGMSEPITGLDFSRGEISHRWPRFLPGGQHFLYLAQSSRSENTGLFIGSLDGRLKKLVGRADFNGIYSAPGHLLFLRDSMLVAQPFDLERLTLEGSPIAIAGPVSVDGLEHAHFDATSAGVLVYRRGGFLGNSELVWFGRNRQRLGTVGSRADFRGVRLSPSPQNQYVAAVTEDSSIKTPDIWIHRLGSNDHERFTLDVGTDNDPVWSPDSQHIAFRSAREGRLSLFLRPLAGIKKEELLLESDAARNARLHDWSSDGRLLFTQVDPTGKTDRDIWVKPIHGDGRAYPLVQAPLDQDFPRFSPNGRWVAFQTTEAGVRKVFVAPSSGSSRTWEIAAGGSQPIWNPNGTELFYLSADNTIMAVEIGDRDATLKSGTPRPVLSAPLAAVSGWSYDVADNGRRFLLILAVDNPAPVTLLVNWSAQLKK